MWNRAAKPAPAIPIRIGSVISSSNDDGLVLPAPFGGSQPLKGKDAFYHPAQGKEERIQGRSLEIGMGSGPFNRDRVVRFCGGFAVIRNIIAGSRASQVALAAGIIAPTTLHAVLVKSSA
jgi:hypothetical protein